ncbi:MAG TPA: hypothetical protein PKL14_09450 [Holophaga sp.]|nr:hypothetical protein [Holophaga sp.]
MRKIAIMPAVTLCFFTASQIVALAANEPAKPNIQALLEQAMANQRRNDGQLTEYTSECKETFRHRNWRGAWVETITRSEHYQSWTHNQEVILSQDGKPVSPEKIQKQREAAARFMEVDMKTKPAAADLKSIEYMSQRGYFRFSLYHIYWQSVFGPSRRESMDGRACIRLDFAPPATPHRPARATDFLSGTAWIDEAEHMTVRIVARVAPAYQANLKGPAKDAPVFEQAYARLKDGSWHATYMRLNPAVHPAYFANERYDWIIEHNSFQQFGTDPAQLEALGPEKR